MQSQELFVTSVPDTKAQDKILVLGMGNPLLCDDSIGLIILDKAEKNLLQYLPHVSFTKNYSGGIDLLYDLVGFSHVIIVDCVKTGEKGAGFCHEFPLSALEQTAQDRLVHSHGISLPTVLRLGEQCGYAMPEHIVIYGVESQDTTTFSEEPSPCVKDAAVIVVDKIKRQLEIWLTDNEYKSCCSTKTKEYA